MLKVTKLLFWELPMVPEVFMGGHVLHGDRTVWNGDRGTHLLANVILPCKTLNHYPFGEVEENFICLLSVEQFSFYVIGNRDYSCQEMVQVSS